MWSLFKCKFYSFVWIFFSSYLVQFERSCNYLLLAVCTEWCSGRIFLSLICDRWHTSTSWGEQETMMKSPKYLRSKARKAVGDWTSFVCGLLLEEGWRRETTSTPRLVNRADERKEKPVLQVSLYMEFCLECYWLTITHLFIVQCDVSFFYEWHADLFIL